MPPALSDPFLRLSPPPTLTHSSGHTRKRVSHTSANAPQPPYTTPITPGQRRDASAPNSSSSRPSKSSTTPSHTAKLRSVRPNFQNPASKRPRLSPNQNDDDDDDDDPLGIDLEQEEYSRPPPSRISINPFAVKDEHDEEEVRRAMMAIDAPEVEEDEEPDGDENGDQASEDDEATERYAEDDGDVLTYRGQGELNGERRVGTRQSHRSSGGGGASVLDQFVQSVVAGVASTGGAKRKRLSNQSSTTLPKSSEEPSPPKRAAPSSSAPPHKTLATSGSGSSNSSRRKVSVGNGSNGEDSPSKGGKGSGRGGEQNRDVRKWKKSAGGTGNGDYSGRGEREEKELVAALGLTDIWKTLEIDMESLVEAALVNFKVRISDRVQAAMAYPSVALDPTSPTLPAFLAPYLDTLRPTLTASLIDVLPALETRKLPPKGDKATFQEVDYEELLFAPLQTLLFSTTETLQTAALDRVLLSFPSILGDEPVAELRVLVEGRKENVLKKVKEGVEMLLRRE